jgi:class 3 adenylate cyclase
LIPYKYISTSFYEKAFLIVGFFCFFSSSIVSQNQKISDSLKLVFKENTYKSSKKLAILEEIAFSETNADEIIIYSKLLIQSAKQMDSTKRLVSGYLQLGNAYRLKSDLTKALEIYFKAAKIAADEKLITNQAQIKIVIADVYSIMGDSNTSVKFYRDAIEILKQQKDSIELASAQLNLGDEYYNQSKLDSALLYFSRSEKIFKALKYELGQAYNLGNEGLVYAEKGQINIAEEKLNTAIDYLEKLEDYYPISVYLNAMADIFLARNQKEEALKYANRSLQLATKYGLKEQISDANLKLSTIYEAKGNIKESFSRFKNYIIYKDSVSSIIAVQDMANERTKFEIAQKQLEVDLLNQQKKTQTIIAIAIGIALILILILAVFLFKRNRFISQTNKIIAEEKQRSDDLLMNILPEETAQELKEKGSVQARKYDSVSVLFTDFKGFTEYSEKLSPEDLVKSIDYYFSNFDAIMEKYDIEKIKTVGDAYMCACGLPFPEKEHAFLIAKAALEIVDFINETKKLTQENLARFDIRVGIHTGPVVAGVVGTKKFAYDIWGDTVNTASRMESSGEIGRVNVSEETYKILKNYDDFVFEPRGFIQAKGKGEINMYFVNRKASI